MRVQFHYNNICLPNQVHVVSHGHKFDYICVQPGGHIGLHWEKLNKRLVPSRLMPHRGTWTQSETDARPTSLHYHTFVKPNPCRLHRWNLKSMRIQSECLHGRKLNCKRVQALWQSKCPPHGHIGAHGHKFDCTLTLPLEMNLRSCTCSFVSFLSSPQPMEMRRNRVALPTHRRMDTRLVNGA